MTELQLKEDKRMIEGEYRALKLILGDMLLEHNGKPSDADMAYYSRKFEEARRRIGR